MLASPHKTKHVSLSKKRCADKRADLQKKYNDRTRLMRLRAQRDAKMNRNVIINHEHIVLEENIVLSRPTVFDVKRQDATDVDELEWEIIDFKKPSFWKMVLQWLKLK